MNRAEILDKAKEYVTKDRDAEHGDMENNFGLIAEYWGLHLETHIDPTDVAVMMTLLKLARLKSNPKFLDNYLDACGYMSCGGELATKTK